MSVVVINACARRIVGWRAIVIQDDVTERRAAAKLVLHSERIRRAH